MISKITDARYLELFEILGIEIRDEKLIKKATGEEFFPIELEKISRLWLYVYKCGDTIVKIHSDGKLIFNITIQDDGIEYFIARSFYPRKNAADSWEGLHLGISEVVDSEREKLEICVTSKLDWKFLRTKISRGAMRITNVFCSLDNEIECDLRRYDSGRTWGDLFYYGGELNLDNYKELLENIINYVYKYDFPKLREANLKCIPILCKVYEENIDFPLQYPEEFKKYLQELIDEINREAAKKTVPIEAAISQIEEKASVRCKKKD